MMTPLIILPMMLHMIAALLLIFSWKNGYLQRIISMTAAAVALMVSALLFAQTWQDGIHVVQAGEWPAPFGISFVADTGGRNRTSFRATRRFVSINLSRGEPDKSDRSSPSGLAYHTSPSQRIRAIRFSRTNHALAEEPDVGQVKRADIVDKPGILSGRSHPMKDPHHFLDFDADHGMV